MRRLTACSLTVLLLSVSLIRGQMVNRDDGRPSCSRCDLHLSCNCSHSGFTRIPMVTEQALTLDLSFNNITMVTQDDLMGHSRLRVLELHGNGLAELHPSAFDSLWSLEELDLSDNQLTVLNPSWFNKLEVLQHLNLLNNPYSHLGSPSIFLGLVRLRRLMFGGPDLKELRKADLLGVTELDDLTVHANNLASYDSGTLGDIWPLGHVTLSLHGPFLTNVALAAAVLADVSYPETPITLEDLHLMGNQSVQPIRESAKRRIRSLSFRNFSVSDDSFVDLLVVLDGVPLSYISAEDITLTGEGRWEKASWTDHKSIDEFFLRNAVVVDIFKFTSFLQLSFLLRYPRKVSVINTGVFVMPCATSKLLVNLQYLDMSNNLLTDLTMAESLCHGEKTLKELRVLNISGNPLKSLSMINQLVTKLPRLTHLDISRTLYNSMPSGCSWPSTLKYLNISRAKLTTTTSCLPTSLEVLDLSYNDLKGFSLFLPLLRELYLSGNKFQELPAGQLFPNLQTLTMQFNTLNMFSLPELQSYRRLENLQAGYNKFICTCDFVNFLQSQLKEGGNVTLIDREDSYACDSPLELQGEAVSQVHLSVIVCHWVLFVSVSCGVALFAGVLLCVLLWQLHAFWYLKMIWAWLKAKRSSQKQRKDTADSEALLSYDAFVSYSERDAGWVENFLVPELEEPCADGSRSPSSSQPLSLCLHKRDFLAGQPIMDNIMSAIEQSRHTIFILSENFVQSDWCRYELDFSHFWLFDVGEDAAILILLEPLSKDDVPKRFCKLRKLMSSTTYLEWPQEEERRPEFWKSLRNALRGDNDWMKLLTVLTIALFLSLIRGQMVNRDDGRPSCSRCDLHLSCNCSHSGFTRVPMVTEQALTLDLSFNNITMVTQDDLMGHSRLRVLDLHGNGLAELHPSAFDSLWSLEELDLSDNQLTVLNPSWFNKLEVLQHLNLLNNPYSFLGSPPLFLGLVRLRRLMFGGPDLKELRREDLSGVTHLEELTVYANNLARYDSGTFGDIWPLGHVTLSLHGPFLTNPALAAGVLDDVYPETWITLADLHLTHSMSVQPFKDSINMIRNLSLRNVLLSDEATVFLLALIDGVPLRSLSVVGLSGLSLTGEGRLITANHTDRRSMDEFFASDVTILDILKFAMTTNLQFLLQYQKKLSIINSKLFLLSCYITEMMVSTQYLDVSDNLLTDLTLSYMLCDSRETLQELRVLNISRNPLKSLSTMSRLVTKLTKLTQLDVSRTSYSSMPPSCSWPSTLRYLNISQAKLTTITPCLPKSLEVERLGQRQVNHPNEKIHSIYFILTSLKVLDLSYNDLKEFVLALPILRELHLSGNKFLRLPAGGQYPNLQTITIQSNTLNTFSLSNLQSHRRLKNLEAGQNKFVCSCEFVTFLRSQLVGTGDVKITDREQSYVCDSPLYLQGVAVNQVNLSITQCQSVLFVSVSCGVALFLGIVVSVLLWRCHAFWFLKMTWAWLKAKRGSQRRWRQRNMEGSEPLLSFDTFVSYSEQDASWVEDFLVPEMETPSDSDSENPASPLTLCLHKRDFLPGHWIIDNIMSAIERSHRTVFVLSENFVQSDWCRYELDFSHFWLFEAGGDAAILILLEPLSKDDVPKCFCKLRKLMSSITYLEWPQEEEKRPEFWRSLRNDLRKDKEQEN
ncbi:LOW QUALITY PROTEIN: toll-like receptor 2 [Anableps anableps]